MISALLLLATAQAAPPAMTGHNMVYSPEQKAVLLIGGSERGPLTVWAWKDGWQLVRDQGPPYRNMAAVGYLPGTGVLMQGGASMNSMYAWVHQQSTICLTSDGWKMAADVGPIPRDQHQMACMKDSCVLFGGGKATSEGYADYYNDTWVWKDGKWKQMKVGGPSGRVHFAMGYDPERNVVVLIGGYGNKTKPDTATWEWNGSRWRSIKTPGPANVGARMAYHAGIHKMVLFGGDKDRVFSDQTWTWDGETWKQLKVPGPDGRSLHAMAYDPERKVIVLFGGANSQSLLGDTWLFDGRSWTRAG